jgi:serine/threonine protein kinase
LSYPQISYTIRPYEEDETLCTINSIQTLSKSYKIGEKLGKGTYGNVYEGKNKKDKVAIKVMNNNEKLSFYDHILMSFKELSYYNIFDCPNILKVKDVITKEMKFKNDLANFAIAFEKMNFDVENIDYKSYPRHFMDKMIQDLVNAVWYLQVRNVANRDIKTANILVDMGQSPKDDSKEHPRFILADFGLAVFADGESSNATGTWLFRPPESFVVKKHNAISDQLHLKTYNPMAVDIWSLGMSILDVYTSGEIFRYMNEEDPSMFFDVLIGNKPQSGDFKPLSFYFERYEIPDRHRGIITDLLEFDPNLRREKFRKLYMNLQLKPLV